MNLFFYDINLPGSARIKTKNTVADSYDYYVCPIIFRGIDSDIDDKLKGVLDKLEFFKDFPEKHVFLLASDFNQPFESLMSMGCKIFSSSPDKHTYVLPFFMQGLYDNEDLSVFARKSIDDAKYLISFQGCSKYAYGFLRQDLINNIKQIEHKYPIFIRANERYFWNMVKPENQAIERIKYFDNLSDSKFVLCPRGAGTTSARFYETIWHGRIPVLISDDTKLPLEKLIDWSYIIRIKENELESIEQKVLEYLDSHDLKQASFYLQAVSRLFTMQNLPLLISMELQNQL